MTSSPSSPRRRHILSSINPASYLRSPGAHDTVGRQVHLPDPASKLEESDERRVQKSSKFRFKSKHSKSSHSSRHGVRGDGHGQERKRNLSRDCGPDRDKPAQAKYQDDSDEAHHRHHRSHRHHRKHREHKRRRRHTRTRSPTPPNPYEPAPLDPDAAFRESLFDAMADDEGASYWEGVYGQPIHTYSSTTQGPQGELEQMDDDAYAAYVRQKMWEKTHQGLVEERAKQEERKKQREKRKAEASQATREVEAILHRDEERRKRKIWKVMWEDYVEGWSSWDGSVEGLSWPVPSGRREHIESASVQDFFVNALDLGELGESVFLSRLKEERVRWHPDKVQQKLGGTVDAAVMRDVTAVFQVIDELWSHTRGKT